MSSCTELIFCRDTVDPDFVTRTLELQPTLSFNVGDVVPIGKIERPSAVGLWKLRLAPIEDTETVEEQLGRWLALLEPKSGCMSHLRHVGYSPYIDCRAAEGSLALCVDPEILTGLGALGVALSVWLYEGPVSEEGLP